VPEPLRALAYADVSLPLEDGQRMMMPKLEARLLQSLSIQPREAVLEIGTGSGYMTALLSRLARHVTSVEISEALHQRSGEALAGEGIQNVRLDRGDGVDGWAAAAPYDVIAVTGSMYRLGEHYLEQLRVGGRLFVIEGEAPVMEAQLITRTGSREWRRESLFETNIAPLLGAAAPARFVL
jgi:protein-L-isoaspartate(D-aspartate) O-methyltransferase